MLTVAQPASKESTTIKDSAKHAFAAPVFDSALDSPVLQRKTCPCGGGCPRCLTLQKKIAVGAVNDPLESEADAVAEQVVGGDAPVFKLEPVASGKPDELRMKSKFSHSGAEATAQPLAPVEVTRELGDVLRQKSHFEKGNRASDQGVGSDPYGLENKVHSASQGGHSLDPGVRSIMESRMRADFSQVEIHTGPLSAQLNQELASRAFTHDRHIYFAEGQYNPASPSGRRLLAHELTHVVQQSHGANSGLIQRDSGKEVEVTFKVPNDVQDAAELFHLFNLYVYGVDDGSIWTYEYHPKTEIDVTKLRGTQVTLHVSKKDLSGLDPSVKKKREEGLKAYQGMRGGKKTELTSEVNKRYYERTGDKPGTTIRKGEEGKTQMWDQALADVIDDKNTLQNLPRAIKALMGPETSYKPLDYKHLLTIAEKLKRFTPEDLAAYKLLAIRATDNLDLFEKSIDVFLARREELKNALDRQNQQQGTTREETLKDAIEKKWQGFDESAIGKMSESDRYDLARQKASELTEAQLQYMKSHPGETAKDFAKSALLMNTGETFSAIGKDIQEAANGDANSWARWAAGTGAGAKLSGWLLAVAGVIYVASWFTGIGELATIAAGAGILLGATLTLSLAESELRIKAASQAKTPQEFKRNIELAAAARANVIVGVALIVIAFVVRGLAKAAFPETMKKFNTSLKNFRERVRLKGSIYELKPQIKAEMGSLKDELAKHIEAAKAQAASEAAAVEKLSTEDFAEKLDKGEAGTIFDQSKLPPEQKLNFRELMKTPEGRNAVEGYRTRLVNALKADAPAEFEKVGQEYNSKIDEFLEAVEEAKNHDDLNAATDKIEGTLTEEHAKQFMQGEQERITQQKLDEAAAQAHQEALKLARDSLVKRVSPRIGGQALPFTDAEIDLFLKEGKDLGLSDQSIEDAVYKAATSEKPLKAADVLDRLKSRAEGEKKAAAAKAAAEERRAAQQLKNDWDRFESSHDQEFKNKLRDFRGTEDLTMDRKLSGGEGQLFLSDITPGRALKRWFKSRLTDFRTAIARLGQAQAVVDSIPALKKLMSVVRIFEKGSDWIVRDFDGSSIPIAEAIKDPNVAAIRQNAIDALRGSSDPMAMEIRNKLEANSANIHWSPEQGKLLIIDTQ